MLRVRWAALALGAGVLLATGCSLCQGPMLTGRCHTGMCVPECEGCCEAGAAVGEGPLMEGYPGGTMLPEMGGPAMPMMPAVPPASPVLPPVNPPGAVGPLVPQPTVPQLSAPPRLVPMPQSQPEAYRP
jgi:hypothetical protein